MFQSRSKSSHHSSQPSERVTNRPRDIAAFLAGYPGLPSHPGKNANLNFYSGKGKMRPEDMTFDEFVVHYEKDFNELEVNHGYIQWLFPIRERGMNYQAQPLELHEAKAIADDPILLSRMLRSYRMMLAFFGIDFNVGHLKIGRRGKLRLQNLYRNPHNLLRITRILKSMSEIGPLQPHAPVLILFFVALHSEGLIELSPQPVQNLHGKSLDAWWSNCIRDDGQRAEIRAIVKGRGGCGEKKWGFKEFDDWYGGCKKGWTGEDIVEQS